MSDLPTAERRAELRGLDELARNALTDAELTALLDATEPTHGGAAAKLIISLIDIRSGPAVDVACKLDALCLDAAALIERQAREIAALQEATTWRGIESAPTEDIFFLIASAGRVFVTRGSIFTAARKTNVPEHLSLRWVTQWAPLPLPPEEPTS